MYVQVTRWMWGYVTFQLSGIGQEESLNDCVEQGILLWNLKKKNGILKGKTTRNGYKKLAKQSRSHGGKTSIIEKKGMPFLWNHYRRRPGLCIGMVMMMSLLLYSQQFIWKIDIKEYDGLYHDYLLEVMEEKGIKPGSYIKNLDILSLQQEILMEIEEFSWLALNIHGSVLEVEVSKKSDSPSLREQTPCNVVARKAGQIIRTDTYKGVEMVGDLDVVHPGELLISGLIINEYGEVSHEHADATVIAKTQDQHTIRFKLNQQEKDETGKIKKRHYIQILGIDIPLFINFGFSEPYELKEYHKAFKFLNIEFSIAIKTKEYHFFQPKEVSYTKEQAKNLILKSFEEYEKEKQYHKILSYKDTEQEQEGYMVITRQYECEENIAVKIPIYIQEQNKNNKN